MSPGPYSADNADDDEPEDVAECFRHGPELDRVSSSSGGMHPGITFVRTGSCCATPTAQADDADDLELALLRPDDEPDFFERRMRES